ncbi:hypothetical protein DevBK_12600 [Devosia sp. BK]|uniref:hypothetical protein n=1 Tax=Devosia sp. BK TaxID=2871706 RepID=UPI00293A62B0|nr:hypothetical protein [Devosia sp. BK]MDV3252172.1 hypothetical protein [Devosia sp. BK]
MRILLLPALVILAASPVLAQETFPEPQGICVDLAKSLGFVDATKDSTFEDVPDGCHATNFFVNFGPYTRYSVADIVIRSPDLFSGKFDFDVEPEDFELPAAVEITLTGFTFAPETGSALNDYIIEIQSEPMDIHFDYSWDKSTGTFNLNDLSVRGFNDSLIALAAKASGFDKTPTDFDRVDDLPGAIEDLTFTLQDARFFSVMTSPGVIASLPSDGDPRAIVASYQQAAVAVVTGLPDSTISDDSKAALTTLINSFPRLRGDYRFHLEANPAVPFHKLLLDDLSDGLKLLSSFKLDVTHQPTD